MPYQIEKYNQLGSQLLSQWQKLWDQSSCAHFFNHPAWFLAYTNTFPSGTYQIIAVWRDRELVAILPLVRERRLGLKTLASLGGKHLSKSTLLLKTQDVAPFLSIINHLKAEEKFYLPEIDEVTAVAASQNSLAIIRESSINPYIPISSDPFRFLSKKQKHKICKGYKKHKSHLVYRCFKGSDEGINIAFAVDLKSSKRKKGKPAFATEEDRKLFLQLVASYKEVVVVDVLYYDHIPIVFSIGFAYKRVYLAYNTAFNGNFHSISPRKILLYYTLKRLHQEGFEVFDFSRGLTSLKQGFTPLAYKQYDVYYARSSLVRFWWKAGNYIYDWLLNNKVFYKNYLNIKRYWIKWKGEGG